MYGRCLSSPAEIYWGVPQGSIPGPTLLLIYVNDFSKCLHTADAIMFADDTNVFLHYKNVSILFDKAQLELYNITKWLAVDKLTLNINITKYSVCVLVPTKTIICWLMEINVCQFTTLHLNKHKIYPL